jgi:hypothetical protein
MAMKVSLFQKLLICLLAGFICGITFLRIGDRFLSFFLPIPVIIGVSVLLAVAAIMYAITWHFKDRKNASLNNARIRAFWIGAIRYGIAFDLAMFGFQKIFHLQFNTPMGMLDEPFSGFSNQMLTWAYFGRSHGFACAIGISQIVGSLLLVFNRTRLLGVIVLFPVLVNIILIDYFYELDLGVLIHALILLMGILYLLFLDYNRLVGFFLKHISSETSIILHSRIIKNIARLSILFVPLILIAIHGSPYKHPDLTGKYRVTDMAINGEHKLATQCTDSLMTLVYFDIGNDCVFEFNGLDRRMIGKYKLDEKQGRIDVAWHYPQNAGDRLFQGVVKKTGKGELELRGAIKGNSIQVRLVKLVFDL